MYRFNDQFENMTVSISPRARTRRDRRTQRAARATVVSLDFPIAI